MRSTLITICVGGLLAVSAATTPATAATAAPPPTAPAQETTAAVLIGNLAPTPPMGWNSWNKFGCNINEELIRETADALVASGMRDAGYEYVNIDDCWMAPERDAQGRLQPDPVRFPDGIAALADYVHGLGLKLGIYSSAGTATCQGLPASLGHESVDAQSWADWGVDFLKYDNCYNQGVPALERYRAMGDALAATGRPIVYSICEWGSNDPWLWGDEVGGDLWRTTGDISDNWGSVMSLLDSQVGIESYSGPNGWNDPDMLEVGNGGMTSTEYRAHMSLWALLNAPLIAGNDLRTMDPETLGMLTNAAVVGVNQDWGGEQGSMRRDDGDAEVWAKPMSDGSTAVVLLNRGDGPTTIATDATELALPESAAYSVRDVWTDTTRSSSGIVRANVPSHGAAMYIVAAGDGGQFTAVVTLGTELPAYSASGQSTTLTTTVYNDGTTTVENLAVELQAPYGWSVSPLQASRDSLAPEQAWTAQWALVADGTAPQGETQFPVEASWTWRETSQTASSTAVTSVVEPIPAGDHSLADLNWVSSTNAWGPVERDESNGEQGQSDGNPLTIAGTVYAKGLGVHAPSAVTYYAGGRCSQVTAQVGVDDETGNRGSVAFEVWGDGALLASSGIVTGGQPAVPLTAAVTDVDVLELRATDGGDGMDYDHADWADARIICPIPAGDHSLADLNWVSSTNAWGPVERDESNGEQGQSDGNPLTIAGTVYAKGLGVHAPSAVTYYAGGRCSQVTAQVGVDDETGNRGSVAFEVWGDGALLASSGIVTGGQPAVPLTAAVTDVDVLELRATDGGDGMDYDHADWADARIIC